MAELKFEITESLGVLAENAKGWTSSSVSDSVSANGASQAPRADDRLSKLSLTLSLTRRRSLCSPLCPRLRPHSWGRAFFYSLSPA